MGGSAKRDAKGLPLLEEIEKGKRAFIIEKLEIGKITETGLGERVWELSKNSKGFDAAGIWTLEFTTPIEGKYTLVKRFRIPKDTYYIEMDLVVTNGTTESVAYLYSLLGPAGIMPDTDPDKQGAALIRAELAGRPASAGKPVAPEVRQVFIEGAEQSDEDKKSISLAENTWGVLKNRFFMAALISIDPKTLVKLRAIPVKRAETTDPLLKVPNVGIVGLRSEATLEKGASLTDRYALYLGPANEKELNDVEAALGFGDASIYLLDAIQYCDIFYWRWPRVDWVARQMLALFQWLHGILGNYGLAVIVLTLIIKACLHPIQRRMMVTMHQYQKKVEKMQPEIKKVEEKYKGQTGTEAQQRLQREKMDVMMKHGAMTPPVAGCLPMLFQIPIFSALYGIFYHAFEIRGAPFLWIKDLAQPDHFLPLPFWPNHLNLLPLIYIAMQFLQIKLTPQPPAATPEQESQRKMMMFMPVVFSVLFYGMPSGLVLYFAVQAMFGMAEMWYIKKYIVKDTPATGSSKPPPAVVPAK